MPPAPRPPTEPDRLRELREYHILDTPAEVEFDDITRLAAQLCRTPTALITLIDEQRQWFKSRCAFPVQETARSLAFCAYTILQQEPLIVPDATRDERFADNPLVTGEPRIRFYAGTPLITPAGIAIGSLAVIDYVPRDLSDEQLEALSALNRQVIAQLELHKRVFDERERQIGLGKRALKEVELQRSAILESALDGIIVMNHVGQILEFNPSAERMFGFTRANAVGRDMAELIIPDPLRDQHRRGLARYLATRESTVLNRRLDMVAQRSDRTLFPVELTITRLGEAEPPIFGAFIRDVTDAMRSRDALRASEERYRNLVETSAELIFSVDSEGRITYVNQAARSICGRDPTEMIGRPFYGFVAPDDRQRDRDTLADAMRTGRDTVEYTTHLYHADGTIVTIRANARVVRDGEGRIVGSSGTARDISSSARAEEALRMSAERLEIVGRATNDAVWDWDLLRGAVWWNENFTTLFGHPRDETVPGIESWTNHIHPADLERVKAGIWTVIEGDKNSWQDEYRFRRADGSYAQVFDRGQVLRDSSGKAVRMIGAMTDITAHREAEDRFTQIASHIGEVFWLTDVEKHTILYLSPAYESIWGRAVAGAYAAGNSWLDAVHPDDRERVARAATHDQVRGTYDIEFRIVRPDGTVRWIHDRAFPVHDETGTVYRVAGVAQDVTEHVLAEERARLSEEQLRHAQKMEAIGSLAGGVAHDFNNILTVIVSYTDMMLANPLLDGELRCDAQEVRRAADRAASLTRQLLAFSRKQVLHPVVVSINMVVEEMYGMLSRVIREDVRLETRLGPRVHPIRVDRGQLEQIIMNLAVNARDAMPGGGVLLVETSNVELDGPLDTRDGAAESGQYVLLSIADTGAGMDEVTRERLFEPFYTTKEVGKGTGLGLSTVHGIVRQSGGFIRVTSEPGHGSTFNIYFPEYRGSVESPATISDQPPVAASQKAAVLLVEDDPAVRRAASVTLERLGYTVFEAPDAATALAAMRARAIQFDVVLSDAVMPGMSGLELADVLLNEYPDVPVLVMSGYSNDAVAQGGHLKAGVTFIEKPFTMQALSFALGDALRRSTDVTGG